VSLCTYRSHHIPTAELEEQVAYFERRLAELEDEFEKEDFDQDNFLKKIRDSLTRETTLCANAPPALRNELQKRIVAMRSELDGLEEQLAAGDK
jgi:polyhydroxyalkanoate synthesis regulator phasin